MKRYVAGFMFNGDADEVLLVQKNRPAWQQGLWNGVGGKLEEGETPEQAMQREFREETGVDHDDWRQFASLRGAEFEVVFFSACNQQAFDAAHTTTDEEIYAHAVADLPDTTIPNLRWLVPMALWEQPGRGIPFTIYEAA